MTTTTARRPRDLTPGTTILRDALGADMRVTSEAHQ